MKYSFDDLKGRNCVITGGFGIIGTALTRGLASAGVNLAVISRKAGEDPQAAKIASEFGVKCIGISASALDKDALEKAYEEVHKKLGRIDILINCAGGNSPKATCAAEQMTADTPLSDSFYGLDISGFKDVFDLISRNSARHDDFHARYGKGWKGRQCAQYLEHEFNKASYQNSRLFCSQGGHKQFHSMV